MFCCSVDQFKRCFTALTSIHNKEPYSNKLVSNFSHWPIPIFLTLSLHGWKKCEFELQLTLPANCQVVQRLIVSRALECNEPSHRPKANGRFI